jgi:hypothetical protein
MFTFGRSADKGSGNLSKQKARIAAQEIISFLNSVEMGFNRVRMKNCSENDISFSNSGDTGPFVAANDSATAPGDMSCHVFHPNGGKVNFDMDWTRYQIPQSEMGAPSNYGNVYFKQTGASTVGIGTAANDIMVHINYVKINICRAYNEILGHDIDFSIVDDGQIAGDQNPQYAGKENFCRYVDAANVGQIRKIWLPK